MQPIAKTDGAQFLLGGRLLLKRGIDHVAASRLLAELQAIGVGGVVEAHRPTEDAILALDQFHEVDSEPDAPRLGASGSALGLVALDGDPQREAEAEPAAGKPAIDRNPPPSVSPAPGGDDDARFRPTHDIGLPVELEVDLPPPVAAPAPPLEPAAEPPAPDESPPPPVDVWAPVPGRIAQGALRKNPALRIALGVGLGLAVGWIVAQPHARRVERRVAELRAEADRERYRPVDEARQRTAALDAEADDQSSSAAWGTGALWLAVAAAAFAGWWRVT